MAEKSEGLTAPQSNKRRFCTKVLVAAKVLGLVSLLFVVGGLLHRATAGITVTFIGLSLSTISDAAVSLASGGLVPYIASLFKCH